LQFLQAKKKPVALAGALASGCPVSMLLCCKYVTWFAQGLSSREHAASEFKTRVAGY
jgi:hypothetical protein